jgi:hypothetical protein
MVVLACATLAAAGLVLGGYPGAVLLPVVTGLLRVWPRRRRQGRHSLDGEKWDTAGLPGLLGWLLAVASAIGGIGVHLVYSADSGLAVTAASDVIPQVLCLLVVGGLAACLPGAVALPSGRPARAREDDSLEDGALDAHGDDGT